MERSKISIRMISLSLALCVTAGALFSLISCKSTGDGADTEAQTTVADTEETLPEETEALPEETEAPTTSDVGITRTPIDNEKAEQLVKIKYESAVELIKMLPPYKTGAEYDRSEPDYSDEDGNLYYKVMFYPYGEDEAPIGSVNEFTDYIKNLFAPEYSDSLCRAAREYYRDADGTLCFMLSADADGDAETNADDVDGNVSDNASENVSDSDDGEMRVISDEFFLSRFTESLFRYTEKITYESENDGEDGTEGGEHTVYLDYIYENDGVAWRFTAFPLLD